MGKNSYQELEDIAAYFDLGFYKIEIEKKISEIKAEKGISEHEKEIMKNAFLLTQEGRVNCYKLAKVEMMKIKFCQKINEKNGNLSSEEREKMEEDFKTSILEIKKTDISTFYLLS